MVTTPNGYLVQDEYDNNPLQKHKSGWNVEDLRERAFEVYGINGRKALRGYKGSSKYGPAFLSLIISLMSQKITYHYPKLAFQLLAVRQIDHGYQ